MIIMAVDAGKARTGIATGDSANGFAFPKGVITEYHTDRLIEKLCKTAADCKAERIVVGLPRNMDGSEGFRAEECTALAKALEEASGIETVLWDERCTTVAAYTALDAAGTYGKKRKTVIDAVAATLILESYFAYLKNQEKQ
ncbi:MAG: Holliday junction resolvase RuvX [Clostridia bacterium]|nr:Holliday junction resolvase RuvX [Clostridia bacterium]